MKPDDFQFMSTLLKQRSGLVLNEDKAYLLESRLMPVARAHNIKGVEELITEIRNSNNEAMIVEVMEAMTTNESFFFRDIKPFDLFRDHVLPHMLEKCASKKTLRIWCAAASNGQEPYSLAMVLKKEENGLYSQFEVQRGLPITMLVKYFDKVDDQWQLKPEIRAMVQYKYYNLLEPLAPLGHFDVVFCRNVLIYFDQPTKSKVLEGVAGLMPDYGMLFLGGAETVLGISDKFAPVSGQRGVYALTGN